MKRLIAASQNWEKVYQISLFPHSLVPVAVVGLRAGMFGREETSRPWLSLGL
jgi:hypothetical protein